MFFKISHIRNQNLSKVLAFIAAIKSKKQEVNKYKQENTCKRQDKASTEGDSENIKHLVQYKH